MTVIRIDNFAGEFPSVSPRALSPNAAQVNRNLFLGTPEFRPLSTDTTVATCPAGTKTMYRFARDASGDFTTNPAVNWQFASARRSYVKGQINDQRSERTYYTINDGSARPRAIDVNGADRRLGVPRPVKPNFSKVVGNEFTLEEATAFLYGEVAEGIRDAIVANTPSRTDEPNSRYSGSTIYGGPYGFYGSFSSATFAAGSTQRAAPWVANFLMSAELASRLDMPTLGGIAGTAGAYYIPLIMLPAVFRTNSTTLTTSLAAIEYPEDAGDRAGTQVLTTAVITKLVELVQTAVDPTTFAKTQRDRLDAIAREFQTLVATSVASLGVRPTEPVKPTVAEYELSGEEYVRAPEWVAYDAAMATYRVNLETYNANLANNTAATTALQNKILALQQEARLLTQEIEEKAYSNWRLMTENTNGVAAFLLDAGGVGVFLGEVDADRIVDSRFYIVTFVTDWGEESEPSEPTGLIEVDQNDSVTIDRPLSTSNETYAARNITKWRIYRSNVGTRSASFQFVEELAIGSSSYMDEKKGSELGEPCPTTTWAEPPYRMDAQFDGYPKPVSGTNPYLRGLTGMPNGIMAGFIDNTVAFCEPYVPYAWPVEYQITTEHPIVGLGAFGTTLFVGTTGKPYFIAGSDSASMSAQQMDSNQACASAASIVSAQGGVLYASPDGLCVADASGVRVVTQGIYTREDWQALNPASMIGAEHEGIYYLFYDNGTAGCLSFDLVARKLGRVDLAADAVFVDRQNDVMYLALGTEVRAVFGAGATRRTGTWKSGRMVLPKQAGLAWVQVYGEQSPSAPATVRWYCDGVLAHTATFISIEPQRLPPGRFNEHEVEVESAARITRVTLASSTLELQAV